MRNIITLLSSTLLACGPIAPPIEAASSTSSETSETTHLATTTGASATAPTVTTDATNIDTSSSTTAGSESTADPGFIVKPDGGGTGTPQCDNWAQNCPSGQKCAAWAEGGGGAWNATKCVDIMGDGAPGDPCTTFGGGVSGMDDCALGSMCWDVDESNQGTCIGLCTGTPDAPMCPKMHSCWISGDGTLNLCLSICDPLLQDCPGDDLCIPSDDRFTCVLDDSGDAGQTNDPCEFANACDKGLVCLNTAVASATCPQNSRGCCQPFCTFPGSPCPNPDQQCLQWFDPMMQIPEGSEDVGVCAIPQ